MIFKNKKGLNLLHTWVEFSFFILLVIGFVVSLFVQSAFLNYIIIFLFGLMAGRFIQQRRKGFIFYLIVVGFLVGYLVGVRYGDWKLTLLFFILGAAISYYIHEKRYIE